MDNIIKSIDNKTYKYKLSTVGFLNTNQVMVFINNGRPIHK